jgi:phosphocarrier protein FPr
VPPEANPFLGLRGIRLSLDRPELLSEQLRALCRTATTSAVSVMFPMVATLEELTVARDMVDAACAAVGSPSTPRVGMMVEVPAAALRIETFLPHLDFVSIGTNDLTQYTLAAERGNPAVASLTDALDPAVLQLIDHVCRAAGGTVDVAVCGETAADPLAIPVLLGLGVRELSVSPHAVPGVKAAVRTLGMDLCRDVAVRSLTLASAQDVRALVLRSTGPDGGSLAG